MCGIFPSRFVHRRSSQFAQHCTARMLNQY
jgi:hypothetical protein